ncbi:hypothetical protein [Acinetobacter sp. 16]|uniref:hypothetical protein n=1 Tax=Acinetobacter sp. 16 TaxID=3081771 RepID=UPI00241F95CF|nr:hypothetical protein [Acinetobacter sp. 16]
MPNQNNIRATVTTHRSNNTASFFISPDDATPQDCRNVSIQLVGQAFAILQGIDRNDLDGFAGKQVEAVQDILVRATEALELLDIQKAVTMANVGA